jgi:hypothetical protein
MVTLTKDQPRQIDPIRFIRMVKQLASSLGDPKLPQICFTHVTSTWGSTVNRLPNLAEPSASPSAKADGVVDLCRTTGALTPILNPLLVSVPRAVHVRQRWYSTIDKPLERVNDGYNSSSMKIVSWSGVL